MNKNLLGNLLLLLTFCVSLQGQDWTRKLDGPTVPIFLTWTGSNFGGEDVQQTNDGGYVMAGIQSFFTGAVRDYPSLIKVNAQGFTVWEKTYFAANADPRWFVNVKLVEMPNGDLLFAGLDMNTIHLVRIDAIGDTIWTKTYDSYCLQAGGNCATRALSLEPTLDGNYILAIGSHTVFSAPIQNHKTQLIKVNPNGTLLWDKIHSGMWPEAIKPTFDGGYVVSGHKDTIPALYKVDMNGDSLWAKDYGTMGFSSLLSVVQAPDSGFVVTTKSQGLNPMPMLVKIDPLGTNVLWTTNLSTSLTASSGIAEQVIYDSNGYYVVTGSIERPHSTLPMSMNIATIAKLDLVGNILVEQTFDDLIDNKGNALRSTSDDGYIMVGNYNLSKAYLVKVDSILDRPIHQFQGYVYKDDNNSCVQDTNEIGFQNWIVSIQKADGTVRYATTDSTGYYAITVDTGAFTIKVHLPNDLWGLCVDSVNITSSQLNNADTLNFGVGALLRCPSLTVDISTALVRRCSTTVYTVSYCNEGTEAATNASVTVRLDTTLTVLNSSIPWTINSGALNAFDFNLGTIPSGACGSFTITTSVSCFVQLGETHCVEAAISPDSLCGNSSPFWDQSDIDVEGICYGDSIVYTIRNVGTGAMSMPREYFVTEDHVVLLIRNFNLGIGDSIREVVHTSNGSVYRLEAEQDVNHPYSTYSALGVSMCVSDGFTANTALGVLGQFVEDDGSPRISIDCQQNVGSWDPNDKRAAPMGYGVNHAIEANVDLEYHIRFQNTGTDTAFNVIIFDTLSSYLDPLTLVPGASSHSYTWELRAGGILVFTFNDIHLPDSAVNEATSHGFVKFKIKQDKDLSLGTIINNTAAIVFDLNAPVLTNTTFHRIEENFIVDIVLIDDRSNVRIDVYPNPFQEEATVVVEGETFLNLELQVVDAMGRVVQYQKIEGTERMTIQRHKLSAGVYFFQVIGDGRLIGTGKVVAQ